VRKNKNKYKKECREQHQTLKKEKENHHERVPGMEKSFKEEELPAPVSSRVPYLSWTDQAPEILLSNDMKLTKHTVFGN
jgi:hypothetical protein